jgi:hypothetical protein
MKETQEIENLQKLSVFLKTGNSAARYKKKKRRTGGWKNE